MDTQELKDKSREKLHQLKAQAEHLHVQLHLGTKEAKDEFERQKKELNSWAHDSVLAIDKLESDAKNTYDQLKGRLEELRVQTALGKAEAEDLIIEQQQAISKNIYKINHELNDLYSKTEGKTKEVIDEMNLHVKNFHTRFDMFRLQFGLASMEAKDTWNEKKKDFTDRIRIINQQIDRATDKAESNWKDFSDEMAESWRHFKKAFD